MEEFHYFSPGYDKMKEVDYGGQIIKYFFVNSLFFPPVSYLLIYINTFVFHRRMVSIFPLKVK